MGIMDQHRDADSKAPAMQPAERDQVPAVGPDLKEPFTQAELDQLRALEFKRPYLVHLLSKERNLSNEFHRYLLRNAAPGAILFDTIMRRFGADPSGVEFRNKSRDAWAFVLPDASEPGRHRVQYFDRTGFFSHHPENTVAACVDTMVSDGYVVEDAGALDRLSVTDDWRRGTEVAGLMQRLNSRQITFAEFRELSEAL